MSEIEAWVLRVLSSMIAKVSFDGAVGYPKLNASNSYLLLGERAIHAALTRANPVECDRGLAEIWDGRVFNINPKPINLGDDLYFIWTASEPYGATSNMRSLRVIGTKELRQGITVEAFDIDSLICRDGGTLSRAEYPLTEDQLAWVNRARTPKELAEQKAMNDFAEECLRIPSKKE